MNPKVNWYFEKEEKWHKEIGLLREIVLACGLEEVLKWGCPAYQHGKDNITSLRSVKTRSLVVLIHTFKDYCALLVFKGVLLKDPENILIQQTENVQAARQIRFTSVKQIEELTTTIKRYIFEAIEVEKAGLKVPMKKTAEFAIPEEFDAKLKELPALKKAFEALTPGRQRGYLLHFSSAKQAKTREARIEKSMDKIMDGKGLED